MFFVEINSERNLHIFQKMYYKLVKRMAHFSVINSSKKVIQMNVCKRLEYIHALSTSRLD
jgi:hypothetical protein